MRGWRTVPSPMRVWKSSVPAPGRQIASLPSVVTAKTFPGSSCVVWFDWNAAGTLMRRLPIHIVPHAPQFALLEERSISQPSDAMWSQSANPVLHVKPHVPRSQRAEAFVAPGHGVVVYPRPSALQTLRSVADPQLASPGVH